MAVRSTKSCHGNKVSCHRLRHAAVAHVKINKSLSTNIVITSPPLGGNGSDVEKNINEEHTTNGYAER